MTLKIQKISLAFSVITLSLALLAFIGITPASAQSSGTGSFQITSSKDISAIQGESFTYFVVTANNTDYQLQSQLPSGLSFSNGSISGTPQTTGEYQLDFVATNGGGTETVNLSVLSSSSGGSDVAQANTGANSGSNQPASANQGSEGGEGSVSLDEIPDTGLSFDQVTTLAFYLLALLLVAFWGVSKFTSMLKPATGSVNKASSKDAEENETNNAVGDGVIS